MNAVGYFVVAIFAVAPVQGKSTPEFKTLLRPVADDCRKSVVVSDHGLEAVLDLQRTSSQEEKCLIACIQEKVGFMRNGKFVKPEEALAIYKKYFASDEEKLKKAEYVVTTCVNKAKSSQNSCEAAYIVMDCLLGD